MKGKKIVVSVLVAGMLVSVPLFAKGKGYAGGQNSGISQPSGQQLMQGNGDGTQPRPMDGTGFGAANGGGKRLGSQNGSCPLTTVTQ